MRSSGWMLVAGLVSGLAVCGDDSLPLVPSDLEVSVFAEEPMVRNPCALTFDARGRLYVGMGPQYRNPTPDTPGDSVILLVDEDGDGRADTRREFATGFNSIQGLAWRGRDLWIANSPDLTVVRDLDGDDQADEYVRVYTDLGNLEHALHGLNWGPDGWLYMSKGNSKGLTAGPDRVAPKPFRDLWGVQADHLPDFPPPVVFTRATYRKNYHHPEDDWGREGGILRCDQQGGQLEIVARGFRNPWDITFDDGFNWLGTDNDQNLGDKIFSPFPGAHFGWGHSWSFDWEGTDHLPTVPASGPLFEGSGTGIIYCALERYPQKYRGVFLINDWLLRKTCIFRPEWNGAHLRSASPTFDVLASAGTGRSMERSHGRRFDPVDIEIGPDEAIYISSWGREYGAAYRNGELSNEGRIYRIWPKQAPPVARSQARHDRPLETWSSRELLEDLGSHLPARRVNAQEELVRRKSISELQEWLANPQLARGLQTWAAWTLGRMPDASLDEGFERWATSESTPLNLRIQAIRILGQRGRLPESLRRLLDHNQGRLRFETLLAVTRAGKRAWAEDVLLVVARDTDRLVFYAAWKALQRLRSPAERIALLEEERPTVRRAALLGLLEEDVLSSEALGVVARDSDSATASLAQRRLRGKTEVEIRGRPLARSVREGTGATIPEVMAALRQADPVRGRELFCNQAEAGCVACHRVEDHGNAFAPDLTGIGLRADPEFLARSIIDPDASITEGFSQQIVSLKSGEVYPGLVLEETAAAVRLAMSNGQVATIPTSRIESREGSRHSAMPSNFAELLTASQIADLIAYLRSTGRPAETLGGGGESGFELTRGDGQVSILWKGQPVATYVHRHPHLSRPAWVNLRSPSGQLVTREFPALEGSDHRWMHPGVAVSFGDLNGTDPWRLKSAVRQVEFLEEPAVAPGEVRFAVRNHYLTPDGSDVVCIEDSRHRLVRTADGYLLDLQCEFWSERARFYLGSQEESGLAVRMAPELSVKGGGLGQPSGRILNDSGGHNEAGTWGREFRWIDYSGLVNGRRVGVLIVPDPRNARPCWSHSRDYGVVVANPLPAPRSGKAPDRTWVEPGGKLRLRFGVQVYEMAEGN